MKHPEASWRDATWKSRLFASFIHMWSSSYSSCTLNRTTWFDRTLGLLPDCRLSRTIVWVLNHFWGIWQNSSVWFGHEVKMKEVLMCFSLQTRCSSENTQNLQREIKNECPSVTSRRAKTSTEKRQEHLKPESTREQRQKNKAGHWSSSPPSPTILPADVRWVHGQRTSLDNSSSLPTC